MYGRDYCRVRAACLTTHFFERPRIRKDDGAFRFFRSSDDPGNREPSSIVAATPERYGPLDGRAARVHRREHPPTPPRLSEPRRGERERGPHGLDRHGEVAGEKGRRYFPRIVLLVGAPSGLWPLRRRVGPGARRADQDARGSGGGGRNRLGHGGGSRSLRRPPRAGRSRHRGAEPLQQDESVPRLAREEDGHHLDSPRRRGGGSVSRTRDGAHARRPRRDLHQPVDARVRSGAAHSLGLAEEEVSK